MPVSPSIITREFDFSTFATAIGLARPAFLGGATKGPLNKPTRVRTAAELIEKFGPSVLTDYGILSAIVALSKGDNLLYTRVSDGTDAVADRTIAGVSGGVAAIAATGTIVLTGSLNPTDGETIVIRDGSDAVAAKTEISFAAAAQPADGDTLTLFDGTLTRIFEFDSNAAITGDVAVLIGVDAAATLTNLIQAINTDTIAMTAMDITTGDPELQVTANQTGVIGNTYTAVASAAPTIVAASPLAGGSDGTAFTFEFDDDSSVGGGNIGVLIGVDAAASLLNLIVAIGNSALTITATDTTVTVPEATLTSDVAGLIGNQTITETGVNITATGMSGGVDTVPGSATSVMTVLAASSGTWGNSIKVEFRATLVTGAPVGNFDMLVFAPPAEKPSDPAVLQEIYSNLSLTVGNARYIETIVEDGVVGESEPSNFVTIDVITAGTPDVATYTLGTGGGTVGLDGISGLDFADYIGTYAGPASTGLQVLRNADRYEFNILAIPSVTHTSVINEMIAVANERGDAFVVVDPPLGLDTDKVLDWHNGLGAAHAIPNSPTLPIDNNYAALYWAWQKTYDETNKVNVFVPPSAFVCAQLAESDASDGPWFPAAGFVRGVTESLEAEYSPDLFERDRLIGEGSGNRVNPITEFPALGEGATIFGNRTLQRTESAFANIHVRRLLVHAKKLIASSVKVLVFDPNDPITWKRFTQLVNPILEGIAARRGLTEFSVQCDENTNPAAQRRQRIMRGVIALTVPDVVERLIIDFAVQMSGSEFTESVQ